MEPKWATFFSYRAQGPSPGREKKGSNVAGKPKLLDVLGRCALVSLIVGLLGPFLNVALGIGELGTAPFISLPGPEGEQITLAFRDADPWWERLFERLQERAFWEAWSRSALAYFVAALVASLVAVGWIREGR